MDIMAKVERALTRRHAPAKKKRPKRRKKRKAVKRGRSSGKKKKRKAPKKKRARKRSASIRRLQTKGHSLAEIRDFERIGREAARRAFP